MIRGLGVAGAPKDLGELAEEYVRGKIEGLEAAYALIEGAMKP